MHIRIDDDIKVALKVRAAKEKTTVKELVTRVMIDYLNKTEDRSQKNENQ
jgi:plasmid stability protein